LVGASFSQTVVTRSASQREKARIARVNDQTVDNQGMPDAFLHDKGRSALGKGMKSHMVSQERTGAKMTGKLTMANEEKTANLPKVFAIVDRSGQAPFNDVCPQTYLRLSSPYWRLTQNFVCDTSIKQLKWNSIH